MELLMMSAEQKEVFVIFGRVKSFVAGNILACLSFGSLAMLALIFVKLGIISLPDYLLNEAGKMIIAAIPRIMGGICLLLGGFSWILFHWSSSARKAKHYQVFKSRGGRFLDLGFVTILLANLIFFFQLNDLWLMVAYWIMAAVSIKVLFRWFWFGKPPQEIP